MGDVYPVIKVAAVQAASVFVDRQGSTEKACHLIREAANNGARLIAFPESFIPGHPLWYHHHAATGPVGHGLSCELFKNSVEIPGSEVEALRAAAKDANAYVIMGLCEKAPVSIGTMFNTQVWIGPDGQLLGKHQKITPTVGERLVHMGGSGDTFGTIQTDFGPASGLMCSENSNPLAIFGLIAEGTRIHVMSWPNHFPTGSKPMHDYVAISSKAFAQMSKAFVVSVCGAVDQAMINKLQVGPEGKKFLHNPDNSGGSIIVGPNCQTLAGPLGAEEGIIYAECNLETAIPSKLYLDLAGHYNRSDIFQLFVNQNPSEIYTKHISQQPPPSSDEIDRAPAAPGTPTDVPCLIP